MNAKNYLKQVFFLNQHINDNISELGRLRGQAYSIGGVEVSKDKIQMGRISDIVGDNVPAIVDLENEINTLIDDLKIKREEIQTMIERMPDERFVAVLRKRYIFFKSWEEISVDLGYTYRHTTRLHGKALQAFERVYKIYVLECPMRSVV